jgi:hypothetical protein
MITCEAARELLLEAEPAELRGEGDSALAGHLRGCAACGQRAACILSETQVLQSAADGLRPPRHAVELGPGGEVRRRRWHIVVPLALAAGVGALLLARRREMWHSTAPAPLQLATVAPPALDVQVPAGQSVAVFQTANPNVVVIWSY